MNKYAQPYNFYGNKTNKRDFHNWKNQAQQILNLLKTTVYFVVSDSKEHFSLNKGDTGFFEKPTSRSSIPKVKYFTFHEIEKKNEFELHHIVPIFSAKNKVEAKKIDDYKNLIYIHKETHKKISKNKDINMIKDINPKEAIFSDFESTDRIKATNGLDSLYTKIPSKLEKIKRYNIELLQLIFGFK